MTRAELARSVAAATGMSPAEVDAAVKAVLAAVAGALGRAEPVRLAGFGTFEAKDRPARSGRNPRTGAPVAVPASRGVRFRAGKALRDAVDGPRPKSGAVRGPDPGERPADRRAMTAPPRGGPLTFSEEVLVLLLNDEHTLASVPRTNLDCVMAGAVLMDLAFAGRIDTDPERLFAVDPTPTGNPLLDPVLARIAAREESAGTLAWLRALAARDAGRIREQALVLLERRGLLERRAGSFNAVFARWPEAPERRRQGDAGGARARRRAGRRIERRVRDALLSDEIPDPRDAALIGLVDACGLLGGAVPEGDAGRLGPRVAQLRRLDLIGRELARAVSEIERAAARTVAAEAPGREADGGACAPAETGAGGGERWGWQAALEGEAPWETVLVPRGTMR